MAGWFAPGNGPTMEQMAARGGNGMMGQRDPQADMAAAQRAKQAQIMRQQKLAGGAPDGMAPQTGARPAYPGGGPMAGPPTQMRAPQMPQGDFGGGMQAAGAKPPAPPMGGGPGAFGMKPAAPQRPVGQGMPMPTKAPIQRGAMPLGAGRR